MTEKARKATPTRLVSHSAIVHVMALVAVGRESEQRTPIAAIRTPVTALPAIHLM